MIQTVPTVAGLYAPPAAFGRMAGAIGELERLAGDPRLKGEADALRRVAGRLRAVMDAQFGMASDPVAAGVPPG